MQWKLFLIIAFIYLLYIFTDPSHKLRKLRRTLFHIPRLKDQEQKKVRFFPTVNVSDAGGCKADRFNPDLRQCVARNSRLASQVGGARKLAYLSLNASN